MIRRLANGERVTCDDDESPAKKRKLDWGSAHFSPKVTVGMYGTLPNYLDTLIFANTAPSPYLQNPRRRPLTSPILHGRRMGYPLCDSKSCTLPALYKITTKNVRQFGEACVEQWVSSESRCLPHHVMTIAGLIPELWLFLPKHCGSGVGDGPGGDEEGGGVEEKEGGE